MARTANRHSSDTNRHSSDTNRHGSDTNRHGAGLAPTQPKAAVTRLQATCIPWNTCARPPSTLVRASLQLPGRGCPCARISMWCPKAVQTGPNRPKRSPKRVHGRTRAAQNLPPRGRIKSCNTPKILRTARKQGGNHTQTAGNPRATKNVSGLKHILGAEEEMAETGWGLAFDRIVSAKKTGSEIRDPGGEIQGEIWRRPPPDQSPYRKHR